MSVYSAKVSLKETTQNQTVYAKNRMQAMTIVRNMYGKNCCVLKITKVLDLDRCENLCQ